MMCLFLLGDLQGKPVSTTNQIDGTMPIPDDCDRISLSSSFSLFLDCFLSSLEVDYRGY